MPPSLNADWRQSPVHLFLLATFLKPGRAEDLPTALDWKSLLGEKPEQVVGQMLAAGVLEHSDLKQPLPQTLDRYTVAELTEMLRERGLVLKGRKSDLITRLLNSDAEGMEQAIREQSPFQCTDQGRSIIEEYLKAGPAPDTRAEKAGAGPLGGAAAYVQRGSVRGQRGDYSGALAEFDTAIEQEPFCAEAYFLRGTIRERLGDYHRALIDFHRTVELEPRHALYYVGRGRAYRRLGDNWLAIGEYDHAVSLDPKLTAAYHNRGVAFEHLREYRRALDDYSRAIDLDPHCSLPYFGRAVAYEHLGDYARATSEYDLFVDLSDDAELLRWAQQRLDRAKVVV